MLRGRPRGSELVCLLHLSAGSNQIEEMQGITERLTCAIYQNQTTFTSSQTPRDLVAEINMTRGVNEIYEISMTVRMCMDNRDCLGFDGDTSLSLDF